MSKYINWFTTRSPNQDHSRDKAKNENQDVPEYSIEKHAKQKMFGAELFDDESFCMVSNNIPKTNNSSIAYYDEEFKNDNISDFNETQIVLESKLGGFDSMEPSNETKMEKIESSSFKKQEFHKKEIVAESKLGGFDSMEPSNDTKMQNIELSASKKPEFEETEIVSEDQFRGFDSMEPSNETKMEKIESSSFKKQEFHKKEIVAESKLNNDNSQKQTMNLVALAPICVGGVKNSVRDEQLKILEEENSSLIAKIERLMKENEQLKDNSQEEISSLKKEKESLENKCSESQKEIAKANRLKDAAYIKRSELATEIDELKESNTFFLNQYCELSKKINDLEKNGAIAKKDCVDKDVQVGIDTSSKSNQQLPSKSYLDETKKGSFNTFDHEFQDLKYNEIDNTDTRFDGNITESKTNTDFSGAISEDFE